MRHIWMYLPEFQRYLSVRLSVVARLKMSYHELHHAYVSIDPIKRSQELLRTFMRVTEARYAIGRAAQQDVLRAATQSSILETQAIRMEEVKAAKQAEVLSLLNRPPGGSIDVPKDDGRRQRAGVNEQVFALSEARHNYEASRNC